MRSGISSSGAGRSIMIKVDSGDSENDGSVMMRVDESSSGDKESLSFTSDSSLFSSRIAVTMIGGESLVSDGKYTTMSAGSYTVKNWLLVQEAIQDDLCHWLVVEEIGGGVSISSDISSSIASG